MIPDFPVVHRPHRKAALRIALAFASGLAAAAMAGCAFVPQRDREFLSDPIMLRHDDPMEATLEGHDLPRREGSVGGNAGSGGGCGC